MITRINKFAQPVILYDQEITETDGFNREIVKETAVTINGVVIGHPTTDDITSEINLSGKTIAYVLAIPADDTHVWENRTVEFYGRKWRTIGAPTKFMDGFMGADFHWNAKVRVEAYE